MTRLVRGVLALSLLLAALPQAAERVDPPAPGIPREVRLPQPVEKTLANGLRVVVVPKHDIPLVAAELLVRTGAASEPAGREGLAQLTAALVTKGTKTRGAEQTAREVEALGARLESGAGWDSSVVELSVMSSNFARAMEYVADAARNATFAEAELELERSQMADTLQVVLGQPRSIADIVAARVVFGDAPYGHHRGGTAKSLAAITRDDVARFHERHWRPGNAILVVAGDVKADAVFALAQKLFGSWKGSAARAAAAPAAAPATAKPRVVVVDMPGAGQASVVVARRGIRRTDPSYFSAIVANAVLGGGYSARLNQEIRIRRGLSYGAGSAFQPRVTEGPFTARTDTKNETAVEAAELIVSLMSGMSAAEIPESELTPRKATLIGEFAQSLETTAGIVSEVGSLALYGLPLRDINRHIGGIQSIGARDVAAFSAKALAGREANVVIVGDVSAFRTALERAFPGAEVVAVPDLDLDSPTLRARKEKE